MSTRWLAIFTVIAALGLALPTAVADRDDKGHKHHHGNKHSDDDDQGWEHRDGYEYRAYGDRNERPAGWSRGKKTGWDNCGRPPGQAKKYGCRTYVYQGRPHYYYQDEQGRIFVRRPIIEIHGGISVH